MRTVSLESVVEGAAVRMGMDVTQTMLGHTQAAIVEYVNGRLREMQEAYPWVDFVEYEQRQYAADWAVGTTYAEGDYVLHEDVYYEALQAGTGNAVTDADYWKVADGMVQRIAYEQAGETAIGEVIGVYGTDPRLANGATEYDYLLDGDGVIVPKGPVKPWVVFTTRPATYAVGDITTGTVPYVCAEFIKAGVAADMLREDGQFEKAMVFESKAAGILEAEITNVEIKQGQQRSWSATLR